MNDMMMLIIKEIDWYFQHRKGAILPIWYEGTLIQAVHAVAESRFDDAKKEYGRLMIAHLEAFRDEL